MRNRVAAASCLLSGIPDCTHTNRNYNNTVVGNGTEVYASNLITLSNAVTVANNANVFWQAENGMVVNSNSTFIIPLNATLEMSVDDCGN